MALSQADLLAIALLHIAISCAYIQVYPASQADSPSFKILLLIQKSIPNGITEREIQAVFLSQKLLDDRIQDLIDSGLIQEKASTLELTSKGKTFLFPFVFLRKILGYAKGEG